MTAPTPDQAVDLDPRRLTVRDFHRALLAAGIVQPGDAIRRVVVDANVDNGGVLMYVERWLDQRMLSVVPTLDGVEVRELGKPPATS